MALRTGPIVMVAYTHYPWDPRVRREAETLARIGRLVTVVCARDKNEPARETAGGVEVHRLPLAIHRGGPLRYLYQYLLFSLLAATALFRLRRKDGIGAVHVHSLPDFLVFSAFGARLRGTPVLLDLHEAMPEIYAARFPRSVVGLALARAAEKASCFVANRIFVVNETIRDTLAARGVPADRITVLYNSPDILSYSGGVHPGPLFPDGVSIRIVYTGGVDRDRDLETLIRAVSEIHRSASVALVIYGRGPAEYRHRLERLVGELGLQDRIRFGGLLPRERVLAHLAQSDVGVATYERNPITEVILPTKVFEYIAINKPLVLPNLRAMRAMFSDAALFYEPGNARDLAEKILAAHRAGPEVDALHDRARTVYERVRWEVQAGTLAEAYGEPRPQLRQVGTDLCT